MKTILIALLFILSITGADAQQQSQPSIKAGQENKDEIQSATKLFPVPVKEGVLNIHTIKEIKSIRITNIIGQPILSQNYDYAPLTVRLETGNPPQGIYLVHIIFLDDSRIIKKILIEPSM